MPEAPAGRWQRLSDSRVGTCFSTFLDSRAAKVGYGVLALAPLADVITDLLTAGNFWLLGHRWWACLTLGIVYMNCRFTIVFMALCMLPSLRNFVSMYLPAAWPWCRCRSGDVEDGQGAAPSGLSKVFKKVKNFRDRLRKVSPTNPICQVFLLLMAAAGGPHSFALRAMIPSMAPRDHGQDGASKPPFGFPVLGGLYPPH